MGASFFSFSGKGAGGTCALFFVSQFFICGSRRGSALGKLIPVAGPATSF